MPNREITLSSGKTEILHPVIARWRNRVKAREAEIREAYAIDPEIQCVFCEDSGHAVKRSDPSHHNEQPCGNPASAILACPAG